MDYSDALSQLEGKDINELNRLLNVTPELDAYIHSLSQIKLLCDKKEDAIKRNKGLAEKNLSQQSVLCEKRQNLFKTQEEAAKCVEDIKRLRYKLITKFGQHSLDLLYSLLQVASLEAEEGSNRVADQYLRKDILTDTDIDEFSQSFVHSRKEFYLRNVKLEKCEERLGIRSRKQNVISSKKKVVSSPRRKSSSPKRPAPLPPQTTLSQKMLTPNRAAPQPPKSKSASPQRNRI